jgi:hypothetical protein
MRRLVAIAVLAVTPFLGTLAPASAEGIRDCDGQSVCVCGTEIAVGLPGKDPIIVIGRIDC